jgi:hypothetical protein
MNAPPVAKRAPAPALDVSVSTVSAPGLGAPNCLLVMVNCTLLD